MLMVKQRIHVAWRDHLISAEKDRIKSELDKIAADQSNRERLSFALTKICDLEGETNAPAQLKKFIYIVSALVHHINHGGLLPAQVQGLSDIAHAILQTQGIKPISSKIGYLYAELHLALSQIFLREGDHWAAAWEQQLSYHLSQRASIGSEAFRSLSKGLRAIRLGDAAMAFNEFLKAEQSDPLSRFFERARIGRIRALRLSGNLEEAIKLTKETLEMTIVEKRFQKELVWEDLCQHVQKTENLQPMIASVRKGAMHYEGVYITEAFLWSSAVSKTSWTKRLPKIRTLARNKELFVRGLGLFYQCARDIELCYERETSSLFRMRKVGEMVSLTDRLSAIDRRLLVLAAAARWLARNKSNSLATLVMNEYRALSLRLSLGSSRDVLGIMTNLMEKSSFTRADTTIK